MSVAYSYLRYSSPQQAAGDSVRRQHQNREAWLSSHPAVKLDTSLVLEDRGRSAFKRDNWDTYALAKFVEHIKSGRVEKGSYLLVENLDRLSREGAGEATELFLSIVNKGVVVVQLSPAVMEFRRPVNTMSLMFAIVELSRGHSESAIKSERMTASWDRKQREAATRVVTRSLPGWVKLADGKLVLDEGKAAAVRRVYELARAGFGVHLIAERMNADRVPVPGRVVYKGRAVAWSESIVYGLLTTKTVTGEYQPRKGRGSRKDRKAVGDPISDYYPQVISPDEWHAVQGGLRLRAKAGRGRRGKNLNVFAGLLKDARDGGAITCRHFATRGYAALVPVGAKTGRGSPWSSFPAKPFEDAILDELKEVTSRDVEGDREAARTVETLAGRKAELDALAKAWEAKMDDPDLVDVVAAKLADLNRQRRAAAEDLARAQREAASPLAESWGEFRSLAELLRQDDSEDLRMRVRSALLRSVESITCLFTGVGRTRVAAVRVDFRGTGRHRDYLIVYDPGRSNAAKKGQGRRYTKSFADVSGAGDIDLRDPAQAAKLEKWLASVDMKSLTAGQGDGRPKK